MKPTLGKIVIYALPSPSSGPDWHNSGGTEAAAVVVGVDGDKINLKVYLNGPTSPWVQNVAEGTAPGTWHWPVIAAPVKAVASPPVTPKQ